MDTQTRRLSLQTKFTDYRNLSGYPKSAFSAVYSPYSASPTSPRYIMPQDPSPRVESVRRHEILLEDDGVDSRKRVTEDSPPPYRGKRLESPSFHSRQARPVSPPGPYPASRDGRNLASIAEHRPAAARNGWPGPSGSLTQARQSAGMPIPRHLSLSEGRRHTVVDEARNILLDGVPASALRSVTAVATPRDRRLSHPVTPLTARRRSYHALRDRKDYLAYGHLEGHPLEADCLVSAFALRRKSQAVSPVEKDDKPETDSKETTPKPAEATSPTDNKVTIRVRVHPRDPSRQPFLMQRNLDIEELRGTIPAPPPTPMTAKPTMSGRPPMSARLMIPDSDRRKSTDLLSPAEAETPRSSRRGSSISEQGRDGTDALERDMFRRAKAIPMRRFHLLLTRPSFHDYTTKHPHRPRHCARVPPCPSRPDADGPHPQGRLG